MSTPLRHHFAWSLILTGILFGGAASAQTLPYPPARKGDVVDDYHGTRVADPYRWLEDPDSPESRGWIDAENRLTEGYLSQIPQRAALRQRLTTLWNYPKYGAPFHKAGRYFFFKNDGLQNQSVLYTQPALTADPTVLLDPNLLSADGTVALSTLAVSEDGRLVAYGTSASGSDWEEFRVRDVVRRLLDDFAASYAFVGNDGPVFYFLTDLDAPRKRVIAIDTRHPERARWREVIPQGADVLEEVHIIHDVFVTSAMHDASSRLRLYALDGRPLSDLALPTLGTVGSITGERRDAAMFYAFTSFLYPTPIFRYAFQSGATDVFKAPKIDFDPSGYETKQVFYASKDGTRVPMFITHRKGLRLDGANPTYLYGYGGFNISLTPSFSVATLVWLEMGGVYAVPNLRGGGGYGEEWHQEGMLDKKQNVFDDFIAAAEYLIAQRYTSTPKLAIAGGSNGGLLVGAAMTQRPDLFGAALPAVGVMDMLRFHKFTIGWAWV